MSDSGSVMVSEAQVRPWRLSCALLALCYSLTFCTLTAIAASGNLAAADLVPNLPALHTVPLATVTLSSGLAAFVLPCEFSRLSRRHAYLCGTAIGLLGSLLALVAIEWARSLPLLLLGMLCCGIAVAHGNNYRFACLLLGVPKPQQPVAIAYTTLGGVLGAVGGPEYSKHMQSILAQPFAGVFIGCMVAFALHALLLVVSAPLLDFRASAAPPQASDGASTASAAPPASASPPASARPLATVFVQPRVWASTVVAI